MTYKEKFEELNNEVSRCYQAFLGTENALTEMNGFIDIKLPNTFLKEYKDWQMAVNDLNNLVSFSMKNNARPNDIFTIDTIYEKLLVKYKLPAIIEFENGSKERCGIYEIDNNLKTVQVVTAKGLDQLKNLEIHSRNNFKPILTEEENAIIKNNLLTISFIKIKDVH